MDDKVIFDTHRARGLRNIDNPALFVEHRRALIGEVLETVRLSDPELYQRLLVLQGEIESLRAVRGSPEDKLRSLLPLLAQQVDALEEAARTLKSLATER